MKCAWILPEEPLKGSGKLLQRLLSQGDEIYLLTEEQEIPQSLKEEKDLHIVPCPENIPAFLAGEKIREALCVVNKARGMLEEVQRTEELTGDASCSIRLCLMNGNEYR
ncbi:MAG: hypothetical protein IKE21_06235 [Erysipelotrichaceae bacterium]|nr:hypothetical protein [Erysipelotrichaceae bacterium]